MGWLAAELAERFDPEGRNGPEGEWRPGKRQAMSASGSGNGLQALKPSRPEQTGARWWSERPNGQRKPPAGGEARGREL